MSFKKGQKVIWTPSKARPNCFGHKSAFEPVECEIISGPYSGQKYEVKKLAVDGRRKTTRHTVIEHALKLKEETT